MKGDLKIWIAGAALVVVAILLILAVNLKKKENVGVSAKPQPTIAGATARVPGSVTLNIAPGMNLLTIADALQRAGVIEGDNFLIAATDLENVRKSGIDSVSLEGYIFPGSYNLRTNMPVPELFSVFTRERMKRINEQFRGKSTRYLSLPAAILITSLVTAQNLDRDEVIPVIRELLLRRKSGQVIDLPQIDTYHRDLKSRMGGSFPTRVVDRPELSVLPSTPISTPDLEILETVLSFSNDPEFFPPNQLSVNFPPQSSEPLLPNRTSLNN